MTTHEFAPRSSDIGRRLFLARSGAFGLGTGLFLSVKDAKAAPADLECKASAADSLLLYIDLLGQAESEAISAIASELSTVARNCALTLDDLYTKVEALEVEVRHSGAKAQIQQMRDAVKLGRSQAKVFRTSFAHSRGIAAILEATMGLISDQVKQAAQDLLPPGKITLTPKSKKLLQDIIDLVRDFHDLPAQTNSATEAHQQKVDNITTAVNKIRDDLFLASSLAADADLSPDPAQAQSAKTGAAKKIDDALAKLEALRPARRTPRVAESTPKLAPFDLLMSVLKGTKESLGMLNASLPRTNETQSARLVPASFTPSPGMPDNRYSRVQQALESHCPRGTTFRTLHCLALILGPLAFPNAATRIPLIAGVLVLFPCPNGDRYSLATTLAAL